MQISKNIEEHRQKVFNALDNFASAIDNRAVTHDVTRYDPSEIGLGEPEESPAYKMALEQHLTRNSYYPSFYEGGFDEMTMLDMLEFLAEIKASSEEAGIDFLESLDDMKDNFSISESNYKLLLRTAEDLGWTQAQNIRQLYAITQDQTFPWLKCSLASKADASVSINVHLSSEQEDKLDTLLTKENPTQEDRTSYLKEKIFDNPDNFQIFTVSAFKSILAKSLREKQQNAKETDQVNPDKQD